MFEYNKTRCILTIWDDYIGESYIRKHSIKAVVLGGAGNIEYTLEQAIKASDLARLLGIG